MMTYEQTRREIAAEVDRALAKRFPEFNTLSPDIQQLAVAVDRAARVNDDPRVTVIDDGRRSGVRLERCEWPDNHSAWLDFNVGDNVPGYTSGRVAVSVDLYGGAPGLELTIHGNAINDKIADVWTLADLRQLRDDLDRLLTDPRLAGALAEQTIE